MIINYRRYLTFLLSSPLTLAIMAIYWLYFAGMNLLYHLSQNPEQTAFLVQWGASVDALTFGNQPWRLGSAALLSSSVLQLVIFSFALALVGSISEKRIGKWRLLVVFALGASTGTLMASIYSPATIIVGGIGGVMSLAIYCTAHYRLRFPLDNNNDPALEKLLQSHTSVGFVITAVIVMLLIMLSFNIQLVFGGLLAGIFLVSFTIFAIRIPDPSIANIIKDAAAVMLCGILATVGAAQYNPTQNALLRGNQMLTSIDAALANSTSFNKIQYTCITDHAATSLDNSFTGAAQCLATNSYLVDHKLTSEQQRNIINQQANWLECARRAEQLGSQTLDSEVKQLANLAFSYCNSIAAVNAAFVADLLDIAPKFSPSAEQFDDLAKFIPLINALRDNTPVSAKQQAQLDLLKTWQQPLTGSLAQVAKLDSSCLFMCSTRRQLLAFGH